MPTGASLGAQRKHSSFLYQLYSPGYDSDTEMPSSKQLSRIDLLPLPAEQPPIMTLISRTIYRPKGLVSSE